MSEPDRPGIAVALEYDGHGAPRVTAKGRGEVARKIVETAREHEVAIEQNALLAEALSAVEAGRLALDIAPEMAGDDLRRAADALARVTGAIGVEDILGEVFSTFCIGK